MAEEQTGAGTGESAKARRTSAHPTDEQLVRQAREAYGEYTAALADAWEASDPGDQARQAYAEYLERARADWSPGRMAERNAEAARSYSRAAQAFLDPEQDSVAAYRTYVVEVAEQWLPAEAETRGREAYRNYLDAYGDALAPEELDRRSRTAWAEYLGKLKDAWGELDASTEPATVAALAQSALAAAAASQSVRGVVRQREAARENVKATRPT